MILEINNTVTIKEVQKRFHAAFPFLKIEFSDQPHDWGEPVLDGHWHSVDFQLSTIARRAPMADFIIIQPWDKVGDVEEQIKTKFGLYPQIFRREEYHWIQTAGTDELTLDEQNDIGRRSLESRTGNLWIERETLL
jgi:hypothetical protein